MELYIKTQGDPNFIDNEIVIDDEVQKLIAQIEVVLFTNRGDVMGNQHIGCNLEDLIYEFNFNNYKIKEVIEKQINVYCPLAQTHTVEVDVSFQRGEVRDIAYVDILINNKFLLTVNA